MPRVGSEDGRVAYLDGIRGLAILAVVSVHWLPQYLPGSLPFRAIGGYVGVDLFFVLSGFIITTILWRSRLPGLGRAYGRFLVRRVQRLYPALIGLLAGVVVLVAVTGGPVPTGEAIRSAGFAVLQVSSLLHATDLDRTEPFAHVWSLSVEWFFYLLWPLLLLRARGQVAPRTVAAWAIAAGLALYGLALVFSPLAFYYGPVARSTQLLAGAALALYVQGGPMPTAIGSRVRLGIAVAAVAVPAGWALFGPHELAGPYGLVGFPLVTLSGLALVAAGAGWPEDAVPRLLAARPLTFLGRISYSLYLWHLAPVQLLDKDELDLPLPLLGALGVASVVVLTGLSYVLLERPFLRPRTGALTVASDDGRDRLLGGLLR